MVIMYNIDPLDPKNGHLSHHLDHGVQVEGVAGEGEKGEDDEVDDVLAHTAVLESIR
jgi:hypothetical protein